MNSFCDQLKVLREKTTPVPWFVKLGNTTLTICGADDPIRGCLTIFNLNGKSARKQRDADLIMFIANHAAEIEEVVRAAEYALEDDGLVPRASSECRSVIRKALAALDKEKL